MKSMLHHFRFTAAFLAIATLGLTMLLAPIPASAQAIQSNTQTLTASAGSATLTTKEVLVGTGIYQTPQGVKAFIVDWTSSSGGAVTTTIPNVVGTIQRVSYFYTAGATQPTNLYDMTLKDDEGFDVLMATGANLTTGSTVKSLMPEITSDGTSSGVDRPVAVCGDLDLAITNAGNAKSGRLVLLIDLE